MTNQDLIKSIEKYLAIVGDNSQSKSTLKNYTNRLNRFAEFMQAHSKYALVPENIVKYKKHLLESGLMKSTVRQYLIELKAFTDWMRKKKLIDVDLFEDCSMPKADAVNKEYLTVEEVQKLLMATEPPKELSNDKDYAMNHLMLSLTVVTGMRVGSLCKLKVGDVDFAEGLIRLVNAKGNKNFNVPVPEEILMQLKDYIENIRPKGLPLKAPIFVRLDNASCAGYKTPNKDTFTSGTGKKYTMLNEETVSYVVCRKYTQLICSHSVSIHSLRHSFSMAMYENGVETNIIGSMLGHQEGSAVTSVYLHSLQTSTVKKATGDAWNKILNKKISCLTNY